MNKKLKIQEKIKILPKILLKKEKKAKKYNTTMGSNNVFLLPVAVRKAVFMQTFLTLKIFFFSVLAYNTTSLS